MIPVSKIKRIAIEPNIFFIKFKSINFIILVGELCKCYRKPMLFRINYISIFIYWPRRV